MEARQGVQLGPHHDQRAEVQPGPEGGIFNDPDIEEEAESPGVVPTSPLPDDEIEEEKTEETAPGVPQEELHRGQVRRAEEPGDAEPPAKRLRAELLEIFFQELEKINMTRNRKEVNYGKLMSGSKKKFDKASWRRSKTTSSQEPMRLCPGRNLRRYGEKRATSSWKADMSWRRRRSSRMRSRHWSKKVYYLRRWMEKCLRQKLVMSWRATPRPMERTWSQPLHK